MQIDYGSDPYCSYYCAYYAADTWDFPKDSWPKQNGHYYDENDFDKYVMGPKTGCGNPKNCGEEGKEWCPGKEPMY